MPLPLAGASIVCKGDYVVWRTLQDFAQLFQRVHGDALVSFQAGYGVGAETEFVNQGVFGNALFLHGIPKGLITDQRHHRPFSKDKPIIFYKLPLEY